MVGTAPTQKIEVEPDESVVSRVQAGDSEAYGEIVRRYQAKLLRYASKFLSDQERAKEIVQDIFIRAYQNIQSFDTSRRFSPWIYRVAHNEFVNALKAYSRRPLFYFDMDEVFPHLAAPEKTDSVALERDLRETIDTHLAQLDPKYREPLILYYLEEMEYKEIAEVLHIPISTVGVRILRGKAMLQKLAQKTL